MKAGNGGIFEGSHDRTSFVRLRLGPDREVVLLTGPTVSGIINLEKVVNGRNRKKQGWQTAR